MMQLPGGARLVSALLLAGALFAGSPAAAQNNYINQNISGFSLPGVALSQGHDEVRAADGTTCRTAVGGSGAYMDIGVIGNPEQDSGSNSGMSAYGRIVVPLGRTPRRIDCRKLYDLEVARLEMELKLSQMGLGRSISPVGEEEAAPAEVIMSEPASPKNDAPRGGSAKATKTASQEPSPNPVGPSPTDTAAETGDMRKRLANTLKLAQTNSSANWDDEGWTSMPAN